MRAADNQCADGATYSQRVGIHQNSKPSPVRARGCKNFPHAVSQYAPAAAFSAGAFQGPPKSLGEFFEQVRPAANSSRKKVNTVDG